VEFDGQPAVKLGDQHVHTLPGSRLHVLAHNVRLDGKFAPAPVHENAQEDARRPAKVCKLVERRPNGAACIAHVVHDHDAATVDAGPGEARCPEDGTRPDCRQVVAVQRDIEGSNGGTETFGAFDLVRDPMRELNAPSLDANDCEIRDALVPLDDLTGHARDRALDGPSVHQQLPFALAHSVVLTSVPETGRKGSAWPCHLSTPVREELPQKVARLQSQHASRDPGTMIQPTILRDAAQ
jgi:hypothetical protein